MARPRVPRRDIALYRDAGFVLLFLLTAVDVALDPSWAGLALVIFCGGVAAGTIRATIKHARSGIPATRKALLSAGAVESVDMKIARDEAAARYQAIAAKTGESLWVDLRCGKLAAPDRFEEYRKPLAALGAAVVLLLACLAGAMLWRGQHYAAQTRQCVQQQARLFKEVMPNQPVPGSIKDRLGSERRKLVALGGQADEGGAAGVGQQVSALVRLRDVLKALPGQGRYRLLDLNIQPDLIRLEGQVQNHADADVVAAGLRQSGLYDVEPPKTQALKERGVGFAFTAIPRLDGGLPKAGPP